MGEFIGACVVIAFIVFAAFSINAFWIELECEAENNVYDCVIIFEPAPPPT